MSNYDSLYENGLYLSSEQQDLLYAALSSSNHFSKGQHGENATMNPLNSNLHPPQGRHQYQNQNQPRKQSSPSSGAEVFDSPSEETIGSARLDLDFLDADLDFNAGESLFGDLPEEPETEAREKRKSIDGKQNEEGGKKRKENENKVPKKPGRKPLTSEPTSKRKAQNRAAQRAFRERKEKHLKDLETKVQEMEQVSQATDNENSLLRAQVERLQIELKEYRKRLSWVGSGNSLSATPGLYNGAGNSKRNYPNLNNEFTFQFPKFGDIGNSQHFNNHKGVSAPSQKHSASLSTASQPKVTGLAGRNYMQGGPLPGGFTTAAGQLPANAQRSPHHSHAGISNNSSNSANSRHGTNSPQMANTNYPFQNGSTFSNSPSSCSESHNGHISSMATSPEPMGDSPPSGKNNTRSNSKNGEQVSDNREQAAFYAKLGEACGCADNPIPAAMTRTSEQPQTSPQKTTTEDLPGFDWLAQQNGGQFDPMLFNDYRDPQDAILAQDLNGFFDDAYPFLATPYNNLSFADSTVAPKTDLIGQIDSALAADDEVVPGEDKSQMLSCTKIWDRLQSMDKFRNGEIDVDNLCSELRTKARCSEGGVVVDQKDVEDIVTRAK